jgi:uncharacterized protein YeaO (DUF488 family)
MIDVERVYGHTASDGGKRFLVERLWPRGIKKESLEMDAWLKDVAPSPALRQWYQHDVAKWTEFQRRYRAELDAHPDAWQPILHAARRGKVTLLYSARDTEHNSAMVLKEYLDRKSK